MQYIPDEASSSGSKENYPAAEAYTEGSAPDAKTHLVNLKQETLLQSDSSDQLLAEDEAEDEHEDEHDLKYRTCSWQHTAGLMLSEYIVLAIMSFPWSYSVLGIVPGLILTVFVAATVLYTGLIISDYCEKFPHLRDVCAIGQHLFGGHRWAWYATAVCFLANNTLIQGLHVLVGAKYLNTVTNHSICSVSFGVIVSCISLVFSIPRTFSSLSWVGYFSAATMFIAVILAMVFAGVQSHPFGYDGTPVEFRAFPAKGTSYIDGMAAFLNIVYTFVGQITYPQFISEMKNPRDFKKVLWLVTTVEVLVFSLAGAIMYVYVGNYYITAPAFGSLLRTFKIISFTFAVPTIIFVGSLYANISARFLFFNIFKNSRHRYSDTALSWTTWIGLLVLTWIGAFIIAEVIPFFSDLLSLMSSLFDCWFGFIFWGVAYFRLKELRYGTKSFYSRLSGTEKAHFYLAIFLIATGCYVLGPGLYASIASIVNNFRDDAYGTVFNCASNGV